MWDGKNLTQENLTQALHKVVHVHRIENPRQTVIQVWVPSAEDPGAWHPPGAVVPSATIKPVGVGGGVEGASPTSPGCLPQLPTVLGAKNKKFPPLPGEIQGHGEDGSWPGSQGDSAY